MNLQAFVQVRGISHLVSNGRSPERPLFKTGKSTPDYYYTTIRPQPHIHPPLHPHPTHRHCRYITPFSILYGWTSELQFWIFKISLLDFETFDMLRTLNPDRHQILKYGMNFYVHLHILSLHFGRLLCTFSNPIIVLFSLQILCDSLNFLLAQTGVSKTQNTHIY